MSREDAATELGNVAALWSVGYLGAADVVAAACDGLVAGLDGSALRMPATVPYGNAEDEVPEILPAVLDELGLRYHAIMRRICSTTSATHRHDDDDRPEVLTSYPSTAA